MWSRKSPKERAQEEEKKAAQAQDPAIKAYHLRKAQEFWAVWRARQEKKRG